MDYRLPYYVAYPMPWQYDDDKVEQYDFEFIKSMYPSVAKRVMPYVEEECRRMAYEGSVIYDEYPDQLQIHLLCKRVFRKVGVQRKEDLELDEEMLFELIQLLVFQELFRYRCRHRKYGSFGMLN